MAYCTNCGEKIENTTKFCPSCGEKIKVSSSLKRRKPPKIEMEKGVIKSLKKEVANNLKSKINKVVSPKTPKENQTIADNMKNNQSVAQKKPKQKWMLFYIIVNILFVLFNTGSEEITGILIFSVIILFIYYTRRKKEKPFNIVLKIFLVLQTILAISAIIFQLENISSDAYSLIVIVCFAILIIINIKLIFKGNSKKI